MKKQRTLAKGRVTASPPNVSKEYYEFCLNQMPPGAIKANLTRHSPHGSYSPPMWYVDERCVCVECGCEFFFTARQQKRWYEEFKIPIQVQAIRCIRCRAIVRRAKASQKEHMAEMAKKPPHPNKLLLKKVRSKRDRAADPRKPQQS
ncbi:MAG TPA: zinc-ribbon domain containing protein [Verrucomicrobiae bacterium]|jgi:hypothetical protein